MKKPTLLASGIILGIAVTLFWERGWLPGADFVADPAGRDLDLSELFYRGGIAYAASADAKRLEDEPFTGRGFQLYEPGQIRLSGEFVYGRPDGKWELWHKNQTLWVVSTLTADGFYPEKDGCRYLVNDNGEMCLENFGNLARDTYSRWYENGQLTLEGSYKAGELEGPYREWHENGQLSYEGSYKAGKQEGPRRTWYENGQLRSEGSYKAGKREGLYRAWHEYGQLRSEASYKADKREGLYRTWHENGQLSYEGSYKAGALDGSHRAWNENGQLSYEGSFKASEFKNSNAVQ